MEARTRDLLIGGKCRGQYCMESPYRGGLCRIHWERQKRRDDFEILEAAISAYFVYAVSAPNGLIKIGISLKPEDRLISLQTCSPLKPLELLGYIPASWYIEKLIHRALVSARSHGEWFRPTDAVNSVVKAICTKDWDLMEKVLGLEESAVGG